MPLNDDDKQFMREVFSPSEKRFFGFKMQELILFVTFVFSAGLNFAAFLDLKESTKWLTKFAKNSDGYHSATTGKEFEQGRPVSGWYENKNLNYGHVSTNTTEINK